MNKPKISVIVPVYNNEKFLRKCLDSIRFQTYKNLEIICINDGSSDGSGEILEEYKKLDDRFVIVHQKNSGVGNVRNNGIKLATGDYISFIDSDDWLLLDLYETFYKKTLEKNIDIYIFNIQGYIQDANDIARPRIFFTGEEWIIKPDGTTDIFNCKNPLSSNFSACNRICKTSLIKDNKIMFPENIKYEDQIFSIKLFLHAKTILLNNNVFYKYRNYASMSLSQEVSPRIFDIFKITDLIEKEIKHCGVYEHFKYALFQYKYTTFFNYYKMCPQEFREKFFKEAKKRLIQAEKENLDKRIYKHLKHYNAFEMFMNCDFYTFEKTVHPQKI